MQKGVSLYLAVIIMTILLAIALGLSTIFLNQAVMFRETGYSVIAFYAADAGIEYALTEKRYPLSLNGYSDTLGEDNKASYVLTVVPSGADCAADFCCIKSIGTYEGVSRAIEASY